MENKDFTDLEVWKVSRILRNEVFQMCKTFPNEEKYKLVDQIVRSSRSVSNNIAEGHGRFHYQENIQFCRISRGSLAETKDHLITVLDCEYIDETKYRQMLGIQQECIKLLNGYIKFLTKSKAGYVKEEHVLYAPETFDNP